MKKRTLVITLLTSLIALCVSSISLSLAWYVESNRKRVDQFSINLKTYADLYISLDGENYKDTLTAGDLGIDDSFYFKPVTSMYSSPEYNFGEETPIFKEIMYLNQGGVKGVKTFDGYISKKIYLKADFNGTILLDVNPKEPMFEPNVEYNKQKAEQICQNTDKDKEKVLNGLNKITDSIRFSIVDGTMEDDNYRHLICDPFKKENEKTPLFGPLDINKDGYYDYFEQGNVECLYGQYEGRPRLNPESQTDSQLNGEENNAFCAKTKAGIKSYNLEDYEGTDFIGSYENSLTRDQIYDEFKIKVKRGDVKTLYLSIYFEGWDRDNVEFTKSSGFISNLKFKAEVESFNQ